MKTLMMAAIIISAITIFNMASFGGGIDITPICADDTHSYNLSISNNDLPFVMWNSGLKAKIYLKYWDGKNWQALGNSASGEGLSSTDGHANYPAVAASDLEHVYLAWMDKNEVYLKFWNGKDWGSLTGKDAQEEISNTKGESKYADIAIDSANKPYVLWNEEIAKGEYAVYLKCWNGKTWNELDRSAQGNGIDSNCNRLGFPKLAINKQDRIFSVWTGAVKPPQAGDGDAVFVRCWMKDHWGELAGSFSGRGINPSMGMVTNPEIAIDKSGNPVVAWGTTPITSSGLQTSRIFLLRWDGNSWTEIGGSASGQGVSITGHIQELSIAFTSDDNPIVTCWRPNVGSQILTLYQWDGSQWTQHQVGSTKRNGYHQPMLRNDSKGNIYVSWLDQSEDIYFIRMKVYSGNIK